jgi:hypothetical protein
MPRRQCWRRSPSPSEPEKRRAFYEGSRDIPRPRTCSTMLRLSLYKLLRNIEATPAAPVAALTFQRFGALRNPPVPEREHYRRTLKPVGLISGVALNFLIEIAERCGIGRISIPASAAARVERQRPSRPSPVQAGETPTVHISCPPLPPARASC